MKAIFIYKIERLAAISLLLGLGLLLSACESFTEVDLPQSELTATAVFEDVATVNAAFANIYAKMRDDVLVTGQGSGIGVLMGLYADELDYYGVPGEAADTFYRHAVLASNTEVSSIWNDTYNLIYTTNSILEGVGKSVNLLKADEEKFMGEALFVRAYLHFYLAQLFGPIPYISTTDYKINKDVSRIPEREAYLLMVQDLLEARTLLSTVSTSNDKIRPSAMAVKALLARIYLVQKDYALAAVNASAVINDGGFSLGDDVIGVFLKNSSSTIWQLKPEVGANTWEALTYIFVGQPPFVALNPELVDSFEADDARREEWIGTVNAGGETYYYPFKYKLRQGSGNEYSILMRLAEQYLIRAEAKLYLGDLNGALQDINAIRVRAGLPPATGTTTLEVALAIENERRHEFFTEQGHRWFDLKRTERANELIGPIKPNWRTTDVLLPIPEKELNLNPNLQPQNAGY